MLAQKKQDLGRMLPEYRVLLSPSFSFWMRRVPCTGMTRRVYGKRLFKRSFPCLNPRTKSPLWNLTPRDECFPMREVSHGFERLIGMSYLKYWRAWEGRDNTPISERGWRRRSKFLKESPTRAGNRFSFSP